VPLVDLAVPLAAGEDDLLSVHHHAHVAAVRVGRKGGLVLALQDLGQLRGEAADDLGVGDGRGFG